MLDGLPCHLLHGIASPETELGVGIAALDGSHQIGSVEVARGFTCYDVVFHGSSIAVTGM